MNTGCNDNVYENAAEYLKSYVSENNYTIPDIRGDVDKLLHEFQSRFSPQALMSIPDDELLYKLFQNDRSDDNLCKWIEYKVDDKYFGGITGGSAHKFGLFQKKGSNKWTAGTSNHSCVEIDEAEALDFGKKIRSAIVRGSEIIDSHQLDTLDDYELLDRKLEDAFKELCNFSENVKISHNLIWIHKYYSLIYPDKFSNYHAEEIQRHILYALQIRPSERHFARSGQISIVSRYANWINAEFDDVFLKRFGSPRQFVRLGTSDSDHHHYESEWSEKNIAAIGWRELGSLENIDFKDKKTNKEICEKLENHYYNGNKSTASRKLNEIIKFCKSDKNTVFVMVDGERLLALADDIGEYKYEESSPMPHQKTCKWHLCFKDGDRLPNSKKGIQTTCYTYQIDDVDNMLFLYNYYYYVIPHNTDYFCSNDLHKANICETNDSYPLTYHTGMDIGKEHNRIIFGAPGTGKSFLLKKDCDELINKYSRIYERVTFHPEYTYAQFVGCYKPVTDSKGTIRYDFVPGPFMRIYVEAIKSARSDKPYPCLLLIEEINRARVAAVFGDIFQLLDRDDDGTGVYAIHASEDIRKYLADNLGGNPNDYAEIKLPDNMYIWATMNSADQGVYPMDTAFKRRWDFEYIGINAHEELIKGSIELGKDSNKKTVQWNALRKAINDKLFSEYHINEDKLMGTFFISPKVLKTVDEHDDTIRDPEYFISTFKNKVIMYLYEDAAKPHRYDLFKNVGEHPSYSAICDEFDNKGVLIFGNDFMKTDE